MIAKIELDLPDLYLNGDLDKQTFEKIKNEKNPRVTEKVYMIKNEVKHSYYFMETHPESGFYLEAKIVPTFAFIGNAKRQINKCENLKCLLKNKPLYKIKAVLYREHCYEKAWEFEHVTKYKKEIYKIISDLKKEIKEKLNYGIKNR
jgi:hypothetical protein